MKIKILLFIPLIIFISCMQESPVKNKYETYFPKEINDGWEIASPVEAKIDEAALTEVFKDFHNDESLWMVRSLSVFRNNKIVAETFTRDENDRTTPRAIWSVTKQFMGVLTGIAIDKGIIKSVDDSIGRYLPGVISKYPEKGRITIKNLLMMRSGIDFDNYGIGGDDFKLLQEIPDSFLEYSLAKPYYSPPGTDYKYKDSDPMILSAVIQKTEDKPTDVWANEVLFSKIGITNYKWIRYKDGITIGSYGMLATPREMAKLAQLVLNGGVWNGERIVSKDWIDTMISPLNEAGDKKFGYLWWSYPQHGTYFMSGNGRQLVFVFPDKELIVAITSIPKLQGRFQLSTPDGRKLAKRIYDACY